MTSAKVAKHFSQYHHQQLFSGQLSPRQCTKQITEAAGFKALKPFNLGDKLAYIS